MTKIRPKWGKWPKFPKMIKIYPKNMSYKIVFTMIPKNISYRALKPSKMNSTVFKTHIPIFSAKDSKKNLVKKIVTKCDIKCDISVTAGRLAGH